MGNADLTLGQAQGAHDIVVDLFFFFFLGLKLLKLEIDFFFSSRLHNVICKMKKKSTSLHSRKLPSACHMHFVSKIPLKKKTNLFHSNQKN